MTTWSMMIIATTLVTADAGTRKADGASRPAPAASTRAIATRDGNILQTSYHDGAACAAPAANGCAPAAGVGCAAPGACAPAACAPACAAPACAAPSSQPVSCYQPMDCAQAVGCGAPAGCAAAVSCGGYGTCGGMAPCGCGCGYGQPCQCGEDDGCCRRCLNRCRWSRAHTTGDMYPHFAYYPQDHGYYYFRPYNYIHVFEHRARVMSWGGDPRNPYSLALFDPVYEEFRQNVPALAPLPGSVQPLGSHLPNLEDLLQN